MNVNLLFIYSIITIMINLGNDRDSSGKENQNIMTAKVWTTDEGEKIAPDFILYTLEGKEIRLSDYSGKIVIIDFWATWCPPCKRGIPDLISIQDEYKDDVIIIGISLDFPSMRQDVARFVKEWGINYPVVMGTQEVSMDYGNIQAIPTTFIIDREGKIINEHIGLKPKSVLVKEINSIINNS